MTTAAISRRKTKRLWTYDEMVAELPETNLPVELWNGEIIMSPAPHPDHQRIVKRLCEKMDRFVSARKLGEVFLSPLDVVPDLAVEVISEGSWQRDRIQKKALYEQFGLPEYWIIDPDSRTIEV